MDYLTSNCLLTYFVLYLKFNGLFIVFLNQEDGAPL